MLTRREFLNFIGAYSLHQFARQFSLLRSMPDSIDSGHPNILILVLDALSASRMSLYGCNRLTTPHIQRLAARSDVYHRHYSGGNFTSSGTASLLTGTYPWTNRGISMFGSVLDQLAGQNLFKAMSGDYHTIAYTQNPLATVLLDQFKDEIDQLLPVLETSLARDTFTRFTKNDFRAAFWGEIILRARDDSFLPSTLFISIVQKIRQELRELFTPNDIKELYPLGVPHNYQGATFMIEDTIDWLQAEISAYPNPFISYLHLWPPHEPYWPRADYVDYFETDPAPPAKPEHLFTRGITARDQAKAQREYDSYLAHTDAEIGRLVARLEDNGVLDNTILILTSDHGQAFEKGIVGHLTPAMFESLIHIPLIITRPGNNQRRDFHTTTSAVDILPSLLHITGQPVPDWCQGRVLPGFRSSQDEGSLPIYSLEAKENSKFGSITRGSLAMVSGDYKLVRYIGYEENPDVTECFDLKADPQELDNLYPSVPIARELKTLVDQKIQEINQPYTRQ